MAPPGENKTMEPFLRAEGISKAYPGVKALQNVDFTINEGEITALVGENGAGKSTLMKIISGSLTPDSGVIRVRGEEVTIQTPRDAQALGFSTIYQELMLIPELSVVENVFLGNLLATSVGTVDWGRMRRETAKLLDQLGLSIDTGRHVRELGVAEQQLIEIAKALSTRSRLLIMDEPTASLATEEVTKLFEIIRELKANWMTIVFVTHHLNEIFEMCDRAVVLRDGRIVGDERIENLTEDSLIQMMVGRLLAGAHKERRQKSTVADDAEAVLSVRNLTRRPELDDISFDLKRGEIIGLAGLMGAGRTELVRCLFGADAIHSGEIKLRGEMIRVTSPGKALRAGIGLAPEDRKTEGLILNLPIVENVSLPTVHTRTSLAGIKHRTEHREIHSLSERMNVKFQSVRQHVGSLSGGNQQKIVLAKLISSNVDIYLLDEPTRGVDVGAKEVIYDLVRELTLQGAAVIVISSVIEELVRVCDRIICLHLGRVTGEFAHGDFDLDTIMLRAMGKKITAAPGAPPPDIEQQAEPV